jgi:hypothetical protein
MSEMRWWVCGAVLLASATAWGQVGVLVGLASASHHLRTVWLTGDAPPLEVTPLVVPRRTGFWRLGVLPTCFHDPSIVEGEVELYTDEHVWATPAGVRPKVEVSEPGEKRGPCPERPVHCRVDGEVIIHFVWPELVSLTYARSSVCGAHPGGHRIPGVHRLDALEGNGLPIQQVLGARGAQALAAGFIRDSAVDDNAECSTDPAGPDPTRWWIQRERGQWLIRGDVVGSRLCGYGFVFDLDIPLPRKLERAGPSPVAGVQEAFPAPGGEGALLPRQERVELLWLAAPLASARRDGDEAVVMVEWALGEQVARWSTALAELRDHPPPPPVLLHRPQPPLFVQPPW